MLTGMCFVQGWPLPSCTLQWWWSQMLLGCLALARIGCRQIQNSPLCKKPDFFYKSQFLEDLPKRASSCASVCLVEELAFIESVGDSVEILESE